MIKISFLIIFTNTFNKYHAESNALNLSNNIIHTVIFCVFFIQKSYFKMPVYIYIIIDKGGKL